MLRHLSVLVSAVVLGSATSYLTTHCRVGIRRKVTGSRCGRHLPQLSSERNRPVQDVLNQLTKRRSFSGLVKEKIVESIDDIFFDSLKGGGEQSPPATKERVVVLGSGWGSHALLSAIDANRYEVTVISPRNYFLFTPMLAGAAVGTVEYRSITQPIREANPLVDYLEATCKDVNLERNEVVCEAVVCAGTSCDIKDFVLPYDHLVIGVGAATNTFGIPGVLEHCNFLKQVEDAAQLRNGIGNCFERANIPGCTDLEKQDALTFAIIGAGPTGVEFVAELCDFIEQDVARVYPHLLPFVRVKLIEAANKVLVAFDSELQVKALETLQARRCVVGGGGVAEGGEEGEGLVEVLLQAGVKEVTSDSILLADGRFIRYGLSVWAAGNGPVPLVLDLTKRIAEQSALQGTARGRLVVDPWLRVKGTGSSSSSSSVWSLGDCAMVDGETYPATAQVAAQQGAFLARLFSRNYDLASSPPRILAGADKVGIEQTLSSLLGRKGTGDYPKAFQFLDLGILAYLGDSKALAQVCPLDSAKL